jgi:hypothetical protein
VDVPGYSRRVRIEARVAALLDSPKARYLLARLGSTGPGMVVDRNVSNGSISANRLDEFADNELRLAEIAFEAVLDWQWSAHRRRLGELLAARSGDLAPVARRLAELPAAQWWWRPLRRAGQAWIVLPGEHGAEPMHDFVVDFRPYRSDATKPATALWTSTSVGDLPSAWLFHGWDGLVDLPLAVWRLRVDASARVYEIADPADWVRLCERYPADTTNVYADKWQHDWAFPTGTVITPDWQTMAEDWDGIHLSMAGLLTASSLLLPVLGGHTLLEGWETESTVWFRWVFSRVKRLPDWRDPLPYGASPHPHSENAAHRLHAG